LRPVVVEQEPKRYRPSPIYHITLISGPLHDEMPADPAPGFFQNGNGSRLSRAAARAVLADLDQSMEARYINLSQDRARWLEKGDK